MLHFGLIVRADSRTRLTLVAALALAGIASVRADAAPPLVLESTAPMPAARADVVRQAPVTVDVDRLATLREGDSLALSVFDAWSVTGEVTRRHADRAQRYTLSGTLEGAVPGSFTIAVHDDAVSALIRDGAQTYRIATGPDGRPMLDEMHMPGVEGCAGCAAARMRPREAGGIAGAGCGESLVQDLLVVYTPQARDAAGGQAEVNATIDMMVADANLAYANSQVDLEVNLVYTMQVADDYDNIALADLAGRHDGELDTIHWLRDAYGADLVALVRSGGGGVAYGLSEFNPGFADLGFSVNGYNSAPAMVLAHEMGHNQGCCHAIGDGGGCFGMGLLFEYSNGHRWFGDSGTQWRTVMAYSPGSRIPNFSHPDIEHDGVATGVPVDSPDAADNARTIVSSATFVAAYRCNDGICEGLDLDSEAFEDCNGNGVPDACDAARGLVLPPGCETPSNDECSGSSPLYDGVHDIDTSIANTSLAREPLCDEIRSDVWFKYLPSQAGEVRVRVCAGFTSRVALYESCPFGDATAVACSGDACAAPATLAMETPGTLWIRVGSDADGAWGAAQLIVESGFTGDLDGDGVVGPFDLALMLDAFGPCVDGAMCPSDLSGDGDVDAEDLAMLLDAWD